MRMRLSIIAGIAAIQAGAALAQTPLPPPQFVPREASLRQYDWAQIFPVTPAFADWTPAGQLLNDSDLHVADAWLHRDSLRINRAGKFPLIEADTLLHFNGQGGIAPGYARYYLVISCGDPTITLIKAAGNVTLSGGVIRPASALTEVRGVQYDVAFARLICFDQSYQSRFLARN